MNRIEDTLGLFGAGMGTSTYGDIQCDVCGKKYNEGEDERGVYNGDSVSEAHFAGMTVCECCFGAIEQGVLQHMGDILPWYRRYLVRQKTLLETRIGQLKAAEEIDQVMAPFLQGWHPMSDAPLNATDVWLLFRDGRQEVAHWAHGGGEDQPVFGPAWFKKCGSGYVQVSGTPYAWQEVTQ